MLCMYQPRLIIYTNIVVIVNDFSLCMWIGLIKLKSDTFTYFEKWYNESIDQGTKIQLCSD